MSNVSRQIYGKNIHFHGTESPVNLSAPDSSLELTGNINIVDSAAGGDAGLQIGGVDILDFVGTTATYSTISDNILATTDGFIVGNHPDSDGDILLRLPLISTLTAAKKYRIEMKGSLRMSTRGVRILAHADTTDVTIGDSFDGKGQENATVPPTVWDHQGITYHKRGVIEIESVVGGYPGIGSGSGWRIISSHLADYSLTKTPVHAASTANVTFPIYAGQTLDGVTLVKGDRILLKDQTVGTQNGVYIVSADAQHPDVRSGDMQGNITYASGYEFRCASGTVNLDTKWYVSNAHNSDRVAVDVLVFKKVAGQLSLTQPPSVVVQATNINTGVTLNQAAGRIQTVSMTVATHARETFTVTCSECKAGSIVMLGIQDYSGNGSISVKAHSVANGSFDVILSNASGVSLNSTCIIGMIIA